jgi:signal transduction histidine kinase/CheY-like chemotaxis protein
MTPAPTIDQVSARVPDLANVSPDLHAPIKVQRLLAQPQVHSVDWQLNVASACLASGNVSLLAHHAAQATQAVFQSGSTARLAEAWQYQAHALIIQGSYGAARQVVLQMDLLAKSGSDREATARYLESVGWLLLRSGDFRTGEFPESQQVFTEALQAYRELGDTLGQIRAYEGLASSIAGLGTYIPALEVIDEGLALCAEHDEWTEAHRLLVARALALRDQGYRAPAIEAFELAIQWCEFVGDEATLARALTGVGILYGYGIHSVPDLFIKAERSFLRAIALSDRGGARQICMEARLGLANLYDKADLPEKALAEREEATRLADEITFEGAGKLRALWELQQVAAELVRQERFRTRMLEAAESSLDALFVFDAYRHQDGSIGEMVSEFRNSAANGLIKGNATSPWMLSDLCERPVFRDLSPVVQRAVTDRLVHEDEVEVLGEDGSSSWFARRVVPAGDGAAVTVRDVTDAHLAAEALREAAQLAKAADSAKSEFLANMSHEVRTPINGVLGLARLLADTDLTDTQRAYIDGITASADILLNVIGDVLDLSKIEAGGLDVDPSPTALRDLVDDVGRLFAGQAKQRGLELSSFVDGSVPPAVLADGSRLRQILANLVGNAVKFTYQGSIQIRVVPSEDQIRFEVCDTGTGIPADRLESIFEAFQQGDVSSRTQGGTGLGLTISRRLVTLMNGTMGVKSTLGEGSCFWFDLPLPAADLPVADAVDEAPATVSLEGLNVLLAEDNPVNVLVARGLLESMGCRVEVASNGLAAVLAASERSFDIILMDVRMPTIDGLAATRRIRREETILGRRTPIIALTAGALTEERDHCFEAGMDAYLGKPFTPDALRTTLSHWAVRSDS